MPLASGIFGLSRSADATFDSFCVVVPMFNEASGARDCVRAITSELSKFGERPVLIAVNDGSTDSTLDVLYDLSKSMPKLRIVDKGRNEGYGAALRTGAEVAAPMGFEYAIFMDSDLTNDPADIGKFVERMQVGCDVIKGCRFMTGGGMLGVPEGRAIFSRVGNGIGRVLFRVGIRDVTNGFRAVRLRLLLRASVKERGFASIVEELYQCKTLGASFCEVPVVLTNRTSALRRTSFSYQPSTFYRYLKYCFLAFGMRT